MSGCGCNSNPCSCSSAGNCTCYTTPCICACPAPARPRTLCDRDRKNNVWVEGVVDENGNGGICLLDTLCEGQIIGILQVDEVARADLKRVTSDAHLLELAETIPRLPLEEPGDKLQHEVNRNADSIPFYSIFRGQPPFAQ